MIAQTAAGDNADEKRALLLDAAEEEEGTLAEIAPKTTVQLTMAASSSLANGKLAESSGEVRIPVSRFF